MKEHHSSSPKKNQFCIGRNPLVTPHVGKVRSLKEVQAQQQPKEWIIDEFGVSGACVLLAADKGSGKTSLMYGMAAAVQNGETFMGQLTTQKRIEDLAR